MHFIFKYTSSILLFLDHIKFETAAILDVNTLDMQMR